MTKRLIVSITTLPGRGSDQIAAFTRLAPIVRSEKGCLQYDLHAVEGSEDQFVILEEWESQADLDAHGSAPHMVAAASTNASFRAGPADVRHISPQPLA